MRQRKWLRKKRVWALLALGLLAAFILSLPGVRVLMQQAPLSPKTRILQPAISMDDLPEYAQRLQAQVYGPILPFDITDIAPPREIVDHAFAASVTIEELALTGSFGALSQTFHVVLITPKGEGPFPVIISQNFCPNHQVVPVQGLTKPSGDYFDCGGDGMMSAGFGYFFGRYITTPPIEMIAKSGYALAVMFPHEVVPDSAAQGLTRLSQLFSDLTPEARPGALSAWAAQEIAVAGHLKSDPRFGSRIAYGHSRYGKTALMAAAFSDDIDGVIAHQSGTGGASSMSDDVGESVADITEGYPHWFSSNFGQLTHEQRADVDAHLLLALIAPRPILLGNARRDVWSDPNGAFIAAQAASPAYEAYDLSGLDQAKLNAFNPAADIAFWMRPGTHGIVEEDWPAFLLFLDAHFK